VKTISGHKESHDLNIHLVTIPLSLWVIIPEVKSSVPKNKATSTLLPEFQKVLKLLAKLFILLLLFLGLQYSPILLPSRICQQFFHSLHKKIKLRQTKCQIGHGDAWTVKIQSTQGQPEKSKLKFFPFFYIGFLNQCFLPVLRSRKFVFRLQIVL